jgi:hypothetical protein
MNTEDAHVNATGSALACPGAASEAATPLSSFAAYLVQSIPKEAALPGLFFCRSRVRRHGEIVVVHTTEGLGHRMSDEGHL